MKILIILGGAFLMSEEMINAYKKATPKMLQCGVSGNETTPFSGHEIIMATPEEAIDAFLEHSPEKIIFAGSYYKADDATNLPPFMLIQRMLTKSIGGDVGRFLYTNPISVPPFHKEPNFFTFMDIEGMAKWFGLS